MRAHILAWMLTAFVGVGVAAAQSPYRTAELKRLADAAGLSDEQVGEGDHVVKIGDLDLAVRCSQGEIDHVGKYLFPTEMKTAMRSPLPYFLERYFLTLRFPPKVKTVEQMLRDDQFTIEHGSIATAALIRPEDTFAYSLTLYRYTAEWKRDGKTLLRCSFPADFELLYGTTQTEAEQGIEADIRRCKPIADDEVNGDELTPVAQPGYYIRKGSFYLSEVMNDDRYYQSDDEDKYQPVFDARFPAESAANLMLCSGVADDLRMEVKEVLYGFLEKTFTVSIGQWIAYCRKSGCILYYGTEKITDGMIEGTVVAVNTAGGYDHLLSVTIPREAIASGDLAVSATLYPFVPMHNVRNIFGKTHKRKQKRERIYLK